MKSNSIATKIIMIVIFIIVVAYFALRILTSFGSEISTTAAYSYTAEDITTVSGYLIREETVLPNSTAMLEIVRDEGERVGAGQAVAIAYSSADALQRQNDISALEMRLSQLEYAQSATLSASAGGKLDSNIIADIITLQSNVKSGKFSDLESSVSELQSQVLKRDFTYSDGDDISDEIKSVQSQLSSLKSAASSDTKSITVDRSGIYSAVVDGYETTLTPDMVETLTPSQLAAVKADSSVASTVGKIITDNTWYYAANMDEETALGYKVGTTATLRFEKALDINIETTVARVTDTEDGQKTVVFECSRYLPEVTLLRHQTADIVHESFSGIRVPADAMRVKDGVTGVYCLVGLQSYFKPVDVVYKGEGYYLVTAGKLSDNTENMGITGLRIGDRVITTKQELYDGKVLDIQ